MPRRPFRFRLERVLRIRSLMEQEAREAWSAAERAARAAEAQREACRERREALFAELRLARSPGKGPGALQPARLAALHAWLDQTGQALAAASETARTRRAQAERSRTAWAERRAERKALEKLRDRHHEALRREERDAELREIDDRPTRSS